MKLKGCIRHGLIVVMLALGLSIAPMSAHALAIIDFGTGLGDDGGVLTWLGGNNSKGEDVPIGALRVSGAPLNNGTYLVTDGELDYNTTLNTVSISGVIAGLGLGNMTLLSGSFTSFTTEYGVNAYLNFRGVGPDEKAPALLNALGMDTLTPFGFYGFTLSGQPITGTTFYATSTDFRNTAVPEPATMLLLGSGLIGLAGFARRRFRKN